MSGTSKPPVLEGDAKKAVEHRGSHLQIIASAGSGKTETVAQRVASLIAETVPPEAIVAFTFTERAGEELKNRISARVAHRSGQVVLDSLNGLFVGTIHAYCFRLLQQHVPRYETYDVLDDNQLTAFLAREANRLELRQFDSQHRLFAGISQFLKGLDVIENEMLDIDFQPDPIGPAVVAYLEALDRYRLLTYGQQIVRAVTELESGAVGAQLHARLRHLVVDEYQDVNPAQERLVRAMTGPTVELCVVGDDDQAIYAWRGSDVANIATFSKRYPGVKSFVLDVNRRSRPEIVEAANRVSATIPGRIAGHKEMQASRAPDGTKPEVVLWAGEDEADEAAGIAALIGHLARQGVPYRDMAVLVRGKVAYRKLVEQFAEAGIPVQPGGRLGLFEQPEARLLGRTFAWLVDFEWRDLHSPGEEVDDDELFDEYAEVFDLTPKGAEGLRRYLSAWKALVPDESRTANLVGEYYELLEVLSVRDWDLADPITLNRMGTLARFSALLADYESVRRRARMDAEVEGEQVGGQDRGTWYYTNLAVHILNHAQANYEGFDGEPDFVFDAVDLTTVHRAKGLEWPVVFLPSLTKKRFPSSKSGQHQQWPIPRDRFPVERYEGGDADERRLFYVGVTRARDWLSVSRHKRAKVQASNPSPYYEELVDLEREWNELDPAPVEPRGAEADVPITVSYSELASFLDCGMQYRLRTLLGFEPKLAPELGYGKAVHHILRTVAEHVQETGKTPTGAQLEAIFDSGFFLPHANKAAHRNLKASAHRLVKGYVDRQSDDLHRVWETERPFELHLEGVTVQGRADVVLDRENGVTTALAIVDYKTSTDDPADHALQLQVYADAGRREGLDVRGAYIHDLGRPDPHTVDISPGALAEAETTVTEAAVSLRRRDYTPRPAKDKCRGCDVRAVCGSAH
jgi:DNA helicase-2/ATP-dependent DNA helicase PcrA